VKELRISREAECDLDDIWQYLAGESRNPEAASRFVDRLTARLAVLSHSPQAGVTRDAMEKGLRALPLGKYVAYYSEHERFVFVSRIIHGSRDQATAFSEEPEN
jgi:toxin ParE1/3/4